MVIKLVAKAEMAAKIPVRPIAADAAVIISPGRVGAVAAPAITANTKCHEIRIDRARPV